MASEPKHPLQPLYVDEKKVVRFKRNSIVQFLLHAGPYDMNALALMPWKDEDREQFAQLLGFSLGGFADLSYVSNEAVIAAEEAARKLEVPASGEKGAET